MDLTEHPRFLARVAGFFYVVITVCALFAYICVRGQLIVSGNMAETAKNILAHERLFRWSMAAGIVVVLSNLPLGLILYELLKVVNPIVARLALLFIIVSTTLESANLLNHFQPLLTLTLPENLAAFSADQREA